MIYIYETSLIFHRRLRAQTQTRSKSPVSNNLSKRWSLTQFSNSGGSPTTWTRMRRSMLVETHREQFREEASGRLVQQTRHHIPDIILRPTRATRDTDDVKAATPADTFSKPETGLHRCINFLDSRGRYRADVFLHAFVDIHSANLAEVCHRIVGEHSIRRQHLYFERVCVPWGVLLRERSDNRGW